MCPQSPNVFAAVLVLFLLEAPAYAENVPKAKRIPLAADVDPQLLGTQATLAVDHVTHSMRSVFASLTNEFFSGEVNALRLDFYDVPLTKGDVADLTEGDPSTLRQRSYGDYSWGAVTLFLDAGNHISQVNMSLRGYACTVAWKKDELEQWMKRFAYDGERLTLRNKGSYRCGEATKIKAFTLSWDVNVDAPVFDRVKPALSKRNPGTQDVVR